jgi:hypothetical protein
MAINSLADLKAATVTPPFTHVKYTGSNTANGSSYWFDSIGVSNIGTSSFGRWPQGTVVSGSINGNALTKPSVGQMPWKDAPSGSGKNTYIAHAEIALGATSTPAGGFVVLVDRLWASGPIDPTLTTAQTIVTPTLPSRDENGAANGEGCLLFFLNWVTGGAASPILTVSYTNSAGVSGRAGISLVTTSFNGSPGRAVMLSLDAGDTGVKSVESITLSTAASTGTFGLEIVRPIAYLPAVGAYNQTVQDDVLLTMMPLIPPNAVISMMGIANVGSVGSLSYVSMNLYPAYG